MKSVFFLSLMNGAAWGGSEEIWYRTALWMIKNNYRVGIGCYVWEEKQNRISRLKEAGCSIYLLPNKKGLFRRSAVRLSLKSIPFIQYDVIFINQGGWEEILHAPFKNLYKRLPQYFLANHNYDENAVISKQKQALLQEWVSGAAMNFGASGKIFEFIERKFSIVIKKKMTLVNPITFEPALLPAQYPEFINDACIWVMLAELDTGRKSQDILIQTLSSSKWKDRNWQLHFYGKGKDRDLLESLIKRSGLENKVFLKGFTSNVNQTLQGCHLLLQCTRIDAMPLSVVEAMAMARPCVVGKVGDMPVWVEDGVTGFVCHEITKEGIDETLEKCWQQKNQWATIGKNAFDTFIKKYPQPYEEKIAEILSNYIP